MDKHIDEAKTATFVEKKFWMEWYMKRSLQKEHKGFKKIGSKSFSV